MRNLIRYIKDEKANAIVENVIVLPMIFVVIFALIQTMFIMHDRSTVEAAAKRGAVYAAHCANDPAYSKLVAGGDLDVVITIPEKSTAHYAFSFSTVSSDINPYRYIYGVSKISGSVESEVKRIIEKTRIPWRDLEIVNVSCNVKNMFLYQDITVTVKADYSIPEIYGAFGLDTEYQYEVTATVTANDPDEFIRNADLVVDIITEIDEKTGGYLGKASDTISKIGTTILDWMKVE